MARRRKDNHKPDMYGFAEAAVTLLVQRVANATRRLDLTLEQVCRSILPPATYDTLYKAHVLARQPTYYSSSPMALDFNNEEIYVSVDWLEAGLLVPAEIELQWDAVELKDYLTWARGFVLEWNKVREVISWLNKERVPFVDAINYWPCIQILQPSLTAYTLPYREPSISGLGEMLPLLRETQTMVAASQFAPEADDAPSGKSFKLSIHRTYSLTLNIL